MSRVDVIVAGTGPAGLAIAAACGRKGLRVRCVSPRPDAPWTNTYALWLDEAQSLGIEAQLARRWGDAMVAGPRRTSMLGRGYAQIDNARLRMRLLDEVAAAWGEVVADVLENSLDTAPIVIDATGGSRAIDRIDARPPGFQAAWGRVVRTGGFEPDVATFMDWRFDARDDDPRPSFLYALPIDERHVFVEETSLVGTPAMPLSVLARRLESRLDARGVGWSWANDKVERCLFAMGVAPARRHVWPVPYGASAAFVHPATGYSVARSLRLADRMADAIVAAVGTDATPERRAALLSRAVFTDNELASWQLYRFGMHALKAMKHADLVAFFEIFFELDPALRDPFVSGTASAAQVRAAMWTVFTKAPSRLRFALARGALGRELGLLAAGLRTF